MSARPVRTLITIVMDLLIVLAVILALAIVVGFFGALTSQGWGTALLRIADLVTVPFGFAGIKTPYGGVFSVDRAITVGIFLLAEWFLSAVRQRA